MIRLAIALAALVAAAWCVASPRVEPVVMVARAVATEGVREQRIDNGTFRARWSSAAELPPMREIVQEPLLLVSHDPAPLMAAAGSPVRPPLSRKVALHTDVCARHGMRRVHYGKRWRCRR